MLVFFTIWQHQILARMLKLENSTFHIIHLIRDADINRIGCSKAADQIDENKFIWLNTLRILSRAICKVVFFFFSFLYVAFISDIEVNMLFAYDSYLLDISNYFYGRFIGLNRSNSPNRVWQIPKCHWCFYSMFISFRWICITYYRIFMQIATCCSKVASFSCEHAEF